MNEVTQILVITQAWRKDKDLYHSKHHDKGVRIAAQQQLTPTDRQEVSDVIGLTTCYKGTHGNLNSNGCEIPGV